MIGSDSGRITILQYNTTKNCFLKIHEETFGKSGVRRMVPGEYLAVDPKGRAVMIGAFEKMKLVYILNRDQATNLTISSPLDAHKTNVLTYSIAALDVVMDNPIFACLEVDYNDSPSEEEEAEARASATSDHPTPLVHKYLTFYELDLSLNHVTRKYNQQIDSSANLLISVPGGDSGPGGVLICCENCIYYKHHENSDASKKRFIRADLPRRFGFDSNEKGVLITAHATHVQKGLFFFLLQTEYGDLYKVTLNYEEDTVHEVIVKYFDTIPVSTSIVVLKTGFLFNASESGNQYFWQFQGIGDDDDPQPFTSSKTYEAGDRDLVIFKPRIPTNLALIDEIESAAPVIDMKVADLAREYTPQLYQLIGRGSRSSLRVLRHGLAVSEMAVSELPGVPNAVWAIKKSHADPYMAYIVVSFVNATIVLSIGETVVEVKDSGILETTNTLHVSLLADGSILQIHPAGIRHIRPDKPINEWKTPGKKTIQCCTANEKQIVVALTGGEIVYFELDTKSASGSIIDLQRKDMGNDVAALAIAPVPEGRQRGIFLCVGLYNNTVRILSLEPTQTLTQLSMQALPSQPTSIQLVTMAPHTATSQVPNLYLYVGLANGILMRSMMDESAGSLSDTRKRFLGTRPVKLHRITLRDQNAVVALSSRNWLSYIHQNRFQMVPLSYEVLEYAAPFASEQCPEGIVCISTNTLRIITLDKIGELFNQTILPLKNTPRKLLVHPVSQQLVIIETDHNAYTEKQKQELRKAMSEVEEMGANGTSANGEMDMETDDSNPPTGVKAEGGQPSDPSTTPNEVFTGAPHAGEGAWSSTIRIVDPIQMETTCLLALEENEAAFSECICQFGNDPDWYLVVGTVQNLFLTPKRFTSGFLHVYRFTSNHTQLQFLHKTPVSDIPLALASFQKKLAVGVGPFLRLYELGKKKLLRKCENKNFPSAIQSIMVSHDRLYVGDLSEAFHYCIYKKQQNEIEIIADQIAPRYLTAQALLDFDTVAGADKFGNIFLTRLPPNISSQYLSGSANSSSDQTLATLMNKYGKVLQGAQHKLTDIVNFYVGETVMSLQKVALVPGSSEVLVYSTLLGGIGVLVPFTSREDVDFFTHLEMHLRQDPQTQSIVGRDHLAYRSYYFPVKNVIDGDLCEQFNTRLDSNRQNAIAEELVCTSAEVAKRLEDIRNRVL